MQQLCAAVFAALFLCFAGPVGAQDVTLTSRDGAVELEGTLLGFDGEFYRIDTVYGELTVDGTGVLCAGPGCPSLTHFVAEVGISGAATMGELLMPALLEAFALRSGYKAARYELDETRFEYQLSESASGTLLARFTFRATNSDEGFADLLADEADIAMSLREIRPEEAARGYEAGLGDLTGVNRSRVLALDGLVPIVAQSNPVQAISPLDLARVFSGEIDNWQGLGGPDAPIGLHLVVPASGLAQAAEDQLMRPAQMELSSDVIRHARNSDLVAAVASDPFGIGIASFADNGNARPLALTGTCGFSLRATRRTIKTEDYPLTAPLFLYLPARRLPKVTREFLAFTRSPAAQVIVRRAGFVDQRPEELPISEQGDRFANAITVAGEDLPLEDLQLLVATLSPMKRLTTSFRFERGSSKLDAQSRSNVQQLARALEAGLYDGRQLLFVGFSDGEGMAVLNRQIAERRASAVRAAVMSAAETANPERLQLDVTTFGEAMPMACDDSAWGRQVNRRVEVWVR